MSEIQDIKNEIKRNEEKQTVIYDQLSQIPKESWESCAAHDLRVMSSSLMTEKNLLWNRLDRMEAATNAAAQDQSLQNTLELLQKGLEGVQKEIADVRRHSLGFRGGGRCSVRGR